MKKVNTERILVGARMTIYPRGKKRIYYADFHFGGQHCRKSLRTTIQKIARRRATKLEQSLENGAYPTTAANRTTVNATMTILEATNEFTAFSQTEGRRPRTVVKQRGILNRFSDFAKGQGTQQLVDVNLWLVDTFRAIRKLTLKPKSMANDAQLLKQFLEWC